MDAPKSINLLDSVWCLLWSFHHHPGQKKLQHIGEYPLSHMLDVKPRFLKHCLTPVLPAKSHPIELHFILIPVCLFLCCTWHNRGCDLNWPLRDRINVKTVNAVSVAAKPDSMLLHLKKIESKTLSGKSSSCEHPAAHSWHFECFHRHNTAQRAGAWYFYAVLCFLCGHKPKIPAEQTYTFAHYTCTTLILLSSYFLFRNPCYEPSPLPLGSFLIRIASSSSCTSTLIYLCMHTQEQGIAC